MLIKRLGNSFAIRIEPGEKVVEALAEFARQENVGFAYFWAIGGMSTVKFLYVDLNKNFRTNFELNEQCEVLSLIGNITRDDKNEPFIHAHIVLGKSDGSVIGGHLVEGSVYPMLEIFLKSFPSERINRKLDAETKAMFWDI